MLACAATSATAAANEPLARISDLSIHERAEVIDLVRDELEWFIPQQPPIEGQGPDLRLLDVALGADLDHIVVNLTADFVQHGYDYIGGGFEDQMHQLSLAVHELLIDQVSIRGVEFLYDGKDIYFYFPDDRPEVIWERARANQVGD